MSDPVVGGGQYGLTASGKLVGEHPALSRAALGVFAGQTAQPESHDCRRARRKNMSQMLIYYDQTDLARSAIPAGIGELFCYRLAEVAGVRVPPVTLSAEEPGAEDFFSNHVKQVPGGWMLSKRVPASIPVYYLSKIVQTSAMSDEPESSFRRMFKDLFDKRCPIGRDAYGDFPNRPPQTALDAARWDSEQRLKHYAYRSFLSCTYPHSSNVLVDTNGRLWLIDHEKTRFPTEKDDIGLLWQMIADSPAAMDVCRRVTQEITPEAIEQSLADIPDIYWRSSRGARYAVYGDPGSAARHFTSRLNRWNEVFGLERKVARAS